MSVTANVTCERCWILDTQGTVQRCFLFPLTHFCCRTFVNASSIVYSSLCQYLACFTLPVRICYAPTDYCHCRETVYCTHVRLLLSVSQFESCYRLTTKVCAFENTLSNTFCSTIED